MIQKLVVHADSADTSICACVRVCVCVCVCFVQLHVEKGSGRFVPNPPFSQYVYSKLIQREKVNSVLVKFACCFQAFAVKRKFKRDVENPFLFKHSVQL